MRREWPEADFLARAGNGINQQLVGAKLRWIEANEPANFVRIATVFGSYDYINWRLTGLRAVEQNWALEAGFVDLASHAVDHALFDFAHCPAGALPPVIRSHAVLGPISDEAARATGLRAGIPVVGGAADMIASALGAGVVAKGDVLLKFGGSVDILVATDVVAPDARMFLDYHLVPGLLMPNGCMSTGGSGLNWFVKTFAGGEHAAADAAGLTLHQHLDRLAATRPAGADGLTVLPYFLGEKTPIHDPAARGVFSGLTLSHDLGHLWRAMLEAYAYAIAHHLEVLNAMGHRTERFLVSDGGAASRVWMQIVADVLQQPLQALSGHLGSCIGAAWTAAVGTGCTDDWSGASRLVRFDERIQPNPAHAAVYAEGYRTYRDLYTRLAPAETRRDATACGGLGHRWHAGRQRDPASPGSSGRQPEVGRRLVGPARPALPRHSHGGRLDDTAVPHADHLREAEWLEAITAHYIANRTTLKPLPGAVATIEALAARNIPQACVSNSHRSIVDANLDALGISRFMAFTIAFDDVSAGKPDPEPYAMAARRFGTAPADILAVEDSEAGMISAARAGLRVALCAPLSIAERWSTTVTEMSELVDNPSLVLTQGRSGPPAPDAARFRG